MLDKRFVSFAFDDCPTTAFVACRRILEPMGVRATFYIAGSFAGHLYSIEELALAHESGHEIACHTFSHRRSTGLTLNELQGDIARNRAFLESVVPLAKIQSFAFPYGDASEHYISSLLIDFTTIRTGARGSNSRGARVLRCEKLYSRLGGPSRIEHILETTDASWVVLYTHDVQPSPSPFGCTPQLLESACNIALKNGSIVDSVSGVFNR